MANVKKRFVVDLTLNTQDAEKQLKTTAGNMKAVMLEMGKASDKVKHFKQLVEYIQGLDTAMDNLFKKNPADFLKLFSGLDDSLKQTFTEIFGVMDKDLSSLDVIKEKIAALASSSKPKVQEFRDVAMAINELYTLMGKDAPINLNDELFKNAGNPTINAERLKKITEAFGDFATVWDGVVGRVKQGFGAGGSGMGGSGLPSSNDLKQEIDELEKQKKRYQEIIDAFDKKPIQITVNKSNDKQIVKQLIDEYKTAKSELDKLTKGTDDYRQKQLEVLRAASLLKNTTAAIGDNGSDGYYDLMTSKNKDVIKQASLFMLDFDYDKALNLSAFKEIIQSYTSLVADIDGKLSKFNTSTASTQVDSNKKLSTSYDELKTKLNEYLLLHHQAVYSQCLI